jgi:hypothetical protein
VISVSSSLRCLFARVIFRSEASNGASMAKPGKEKPEEPEILPDAWDRFRQAVRVMAKAGPQHRIGEETARQAEAARRKARNKNR